MRKVLIFGDNFKFRIRPRQRKWLLYSGFLPQSGAAWGWGFFHRKRACIPPYVKAKGYLVPGRFLLATGWAEVGVSARPLVLNDLSGLERPKSTFRDFLSGAPGERGAPRWVAVATLSTPACSSLLSPSLRSLRSLYPLSPKGFL